jgi:hypothetical protein
MMADGSLLGVDVRISLMDATGSDKKGEVSANGQIEFKA